ncbi:aldose 1-epimerase family protein [Actinomadura rupiterrae]|uniref:aldose 1-epimerase family protein n=1 Tax=Actinomadura rupiterrae TaxID=559627 RepID=UPI0020A5753A|nr:aldose 1-epimerase family protein [Actinomadura rupiterrae]MCP2335750.1 aldose 1-epimerase [Actinomadura rupiterrae]
MSTSVPETRRGSLAATGEQFEIAAGPYRAVVTEEGAGLRSLTHDGEPLVLSYGEDETPPAAFGQLLIPWPNRVDHGRYKWDGADLLLDINEPEYDNAIHGLVRWSTWREVERAPDQVSLATRLLGSPGYPFRLDVTADYALDPDHGMTITVTAANHGRVAAPYGHGAHPYLSVGEPIDGCIVQIPGARYLPVNDRMIPPGPPTAVEGTEYDLRAGRRLGDQKIDRAFTELDRDDAGRAWVHLSGTNRRTSFWLDRTHPWLEVYTADGVPPEKRRLGLGVEPMTCPPNAFGSGTDVIRLEPGATHSGSWGILAG